ncbi:MAG: hypothetical protein GTO41_22410, partial [Burkholderiales bacterium]|nr:hypothetical protein [Burkholderiales bacterium]
MTKTLAELLGGADMEGGENFCDTIYNNLKNHFRSSAPCVSGGLDELQPGMIVSDEDDDRLYHVILTSACTCSEIVQTCIPVSDDNGVYFGDGNDAYLGYNELNNDALMLGIPTTGRGLIICEAGDV